MTNGKRALAATILFAFAVVATVRNAQASTFIRVPFDEKVANAAAIIVGKCVRNQSQFDASHRWIVTYSTFSVEDTLKGSVSSEITIVLPDGVVDGVQQVTNGMPSFEEGRKYIIFVKNTPLGPTVLFFSQGVYPLEVIGHETIAVPFNSGAVLVDSQRGVAAVADPPLSLSAFKQAVGQAQKERNQRMEIIRDRRREKSFGALLWQYKGLVMLAVISLALAIWQLARR